MITEDYCSYEVAKLLEEKGFHEKVNHVYHYYTSAPFYRRHLRDFNGEDYKNLRHEHYSAPTLQMAMKWLREVHNLYIQTEITSWPQKGYFVKIYLYKNQYNNFEDIPFVEHKKSYEEACEAAIKYCLENLI